MSDRRLRRRVEDQGQATVELALILPLLVGLCVIILEVVQVGLDQLALARVTREAARYSSVSGHLPSMDDATSVSPRLLRSRLQIHTVSSKPEMVAVEGQYRSEIKVPIARLTIANIGLSSRSAMWLEHS